MRKNCMAGCPAMETCMMGECPCPEHCNVCQECEETEMNCACTYDPAIQRAMNGDQGQEFEDVPF